MKKYLVRFTTRDGDYDKAWCYAQDEEEAAYNIRYEYWNVEDITSVEEI